MGEEDTMVHPTMAAVAAALHRRSSQRKKKKAMKGVEEDGFEGLRGGVRVCLVCVCMYMCGVLI